MKHKQKDPNKSAARIAAKNAAILYTLLFGVLCVYYIRIFRIIIRIYRERELLLVDSPHGVYS